MPDEDLRGLKIDKSTSPPKSRVKKKKRLLIGLIVGIALAAPVFSSMLRSAVEVETATVSQVYPSQTFTLLNASGYAVAQRKAAVASKATGRLEWLGVEEGSRVRKGEVIARLENRDVQATEAQTRSGIAITRSRLEQVQAELQDARLNFNRQKDMVKEGIVSRAEYDAAEARYKRAVAAVAGAEAEIKNAEAALKGAEVAVEYTLIRAPFDGLVLTKNADVGDIVTPLGAAANAKAAVVTMADPDSIFVEADVSEANLGKVKVGQPCEIQLDALPDSRFRGIVHMIVPTADRSKATVLVKVRFIDKDKRVLPEMSAKVAFLQRPISASEAASRTAVNQAAVAYRDGKPVLYVVRGDKVAETPVTLGEKIGDQFEIKSGVRAGDKIAVKPLDKLKDGGRVRVPEK